MKAPAFARDKPIGLAEVSDRLDRPGEEAKPLAGGRSFVPALNTRLAAPLGRLQVIADCLDRKSESLLDLPETQTRTQFVQTSAKADSRMPRELAERIRPEITKWRKVGCATGTRP